MRAFYYVLIFILLSSVASAGTNYINTLQNNNQSIGSSIFINNLQRWMGIGTTAPQSELHVNGTKGILVTPSDMYTAQTLSLPSNTGAMGIYVSGKYAYVTNYDYGRLDIVDISNPRAMYRVGNYTDATYLGIGGAESVFVSGKYAYVGARTYGTLAIIDISNANGPTKASYYGLGGRPISIYVSGKYAYIANYDSCMLYIIDVSNATYPVYVGNYTNCSTMAGDNAVYVQGKYAYVSSVSNNSLLILDVSNPASPVKVGNYTDSVNMNGAHDVYVSGRYAYVPSYYNGTLSIIDVSNASSPVLTGRYKNAGLSQQYMAVKVSGKYAYAVDMSIPVKTDMIDVSNASSPVLAATISSAGNYQTITSNILAIQGKYAYFTYYNQNYILSVELPGVESSTASIGDISTSHLSVTDNADVRNNLYVDGAVNVGPGGVYVDAGNGIATDGNFTGTGFMGINTKSGAEELTVVNNSAFDVDDTTIRVENVADANTAIELKSGGKMWHISKRGSSENNALSWFYYSAPGIGTGAMTTFTATGYLGLGDTNPTEGRVTINAGAGNKTALKIENPTGGPWHMYLNIDGSSGVLTWINTAGEYELANNGGTVGWAISQAGTATVRNNLNVNGYLSTVDSNPVAALTVGSDAGASYAAGAGDVYVADTLEVDGNTTFTGLGTSSTATYLTIDSTGRGYRKAVSSIRYKENISDLDLGLDAVMLLHPVSFDYRKDVIPEGPRHAIGFIAEEVENISPLLVEYQNYSGPDTDLGDVVETVKYEKVTPLLAKAIQEQEGMIDTLGEDIADISAQNNLTKEIICGRYPAASVCD
jgi:hypothetical protein